MRAGQTLALAGLIQNRVESQNRGFPWLADIPWAGNVFRRETDAVNEIELLVLVRPELVGALDPHQVPPIGPGGHTTSPNDCDFYGRGFMEVPKCCPEPQCNGAAAVFGQPGPNGGDPSMYGQPVPQGDPTMYGQPMSNGMMPQPQDSGFGPAMPYGDVPADGPAPVIQGSGLTSPQPSGTPQPEMFGPSGYDQLEF